jgi:FixJ family two-component response regulator
MSASDLSSTVYLIDDDALVRKALTRALMAEGFDVLSWGSADAFLADYDRESPGCLVADVILPGTDGLQLQQLLLASDSSLPIVFVTALANFHMSVQAMRAGAITCLLKPVPIADLSSAVREGFERDRAVRQQRALRVAIQSRLATLTPRERQVFDLVVAGKMNKQIAAQLGSAEKTVKVHRGRVMNKMRVKSVAELATLAIQVGEVRIPDRPVVMEPLRWAEQ